MALPKASSVKDDLEKEQVNESSTKAINTADKNGGGGSGGGAINTTAKEESNENAILPSPEDLKDICGGLMARPENAQVLSTLLPTAKEKEERMRCYKKRLEGLFYRMRKKLKQKTDGAAAAATTTTTGGGGDGPKTADGGGASASATVSVAPQRAAAMRQQQLLPLLLERSDDNNNDTTRA